MRRFELVEGTSDKFWEIGPAEDGTAMVVRFGRRGTSGQTQVKALASDVAVAAEIDKLIREKTRKGYTEVSSAGGPVATPPPAPTAPLPASAPVSAVAAEPPIESAEAPDAPQRAQPAAVEHAAPVPAACGKHPPEEDRIFWDGMLARRAWAVRDGELPSGLPVPDVAALRKELGSAWYIGWLQAHSYYLSADAVTLEEATAACAATHGGTLELDAARHSALFALEVLARTQRIHHWRPSLEGLRNRIAALPEDDYREAAQFAERVVEDQRGFGRFELLVDLCFLFPTEPFSLAWVDANPFADPCLLPQLGRPPVPGSLPAYQLFARSTTPSSLAVSLVHRFGFDAVPALVAAPCETAAELKERALLFARIGCDATFAALVEGIADRSVQPALRDACERQPARALRLLSAVTGRHAELAAVRLLEVLREWPALAAEVAAALPEAQRQVIDRLRANGERKTAPIELLPPLLASPPWQQRRAAPQRPKLTDVAVPAPPAELRWAAGEQQAALRTYSYDDASMVELLPQQIEIVRRHLADAEAAGAAGQTLGYWGSPPAIRLQLNDLERRWAELTQPMEPVAAGWIARGSMSPAELLRVPSAMVAEAALVRPELSSFGDDVRLRKLLAQHGTVMAPFAAAALGQAPARLLGPLSVLGCAAAAPGVAAALATKSGHRAARRWLDTYPEHAAAGLLAAALGEATKGRDHAERALRQLERRGHAELIRRVAAAAGDEVLAAIETLLSLDPLQLFPSKRPALPGWIVLDALAPIELRDGQGALPDEAVQTVMTMLAFSSVEAPYAGIEVVREHCTAASLSAFSWSLFQQWMGAGCPSAHSWAFSALGVFGDDDVARRLAALIRVWPGEGATARAVTGLDVLVEIGSDVSLMHLKRIADNVKFKGLRTKAEQRMAELAEARGLSSEELADRLVPDLGLDGDGAMWFDFGPRRFQVGFDELLTPYVKDESGARLRALPKPNSKDDPALASGASDRWKALKKDASAAAKSQIRRIELAMGARRRWELDVFEHCFWHHPLMGHVARRLVWGCYDGDGALQATFRVAEDRSLADVADDTFELPVEVAIGIPHRLELDEATAAAWGEIFADYEVLQPFAQLGREVYTLDAAERDQTELGRLAGVRCHFGRILALEHRGWRKAIPVDGGVVVEMLKALPCGLTAVLHLTEGLWMGMMNETPEQPLGTVVLTRDSDGSWNRDQHVPFGMLDEVELSELLRDLESLRS